MRHFLFTKNNMRGNVGYEMRIFRYRLFRNGKRTRMVWLIYARERATADAITELANEAMRPFSLKHSRLMRARKTLVKAPPYEIEQAQIRHFEEIDSRRKDDAISKKV